MAFQYSLKMVWLIVAVLLLIGDFLFFPYFLGTNFGIYCILLVSLTAPFFKGQRLSWFVLFLLALTLLVDVSLINSAFFLIVFIFLLYTRELQNISYTGFFVFKSLFFFVIDSIANIVIDIKSTLEHLIESRTNADVIARKSFYWLISIWISGLFLFLFYLANPFLQINLELIFNRFIEALLSFFELKLFIRMFVSFVIFVSGWAFLRTRKKEELFRRLPDKVEWIPLELVIYCLFCFNFVFAIQNFSDLYFLLGNGELPKGLSHAEYAHRGAYPLILVTLLSGALICLVFKEGFETQRNRLARRLVYLWLFQNILLVLFTFQRLVLYVSIFNLTRWRYATFVWLVLIILGFMLTFYRIRFQKSNQWFLRQNMYLTCWVLLICCFVKSDTLISYYNVSHCKEFTGEGNALDKKYLESLGVSALPAIQFAIENQPKSMGDLVAVQKNILLLHESVALNWREKSLYESFLIYCYRESNPDKSK